jgi:predicted amidophosphoribosyltransferase
MKDKVKEWERHLNLLKSELWWECPICKCAQRKRTKYCPDCGQRLASDNEITHNEVAKMLKMGRK